MTEFFAYTNCIAGIASWDRLWNASVNNAQFRRELKTWLGRYLYKRLINRSEKHFSLASSQILSEHEYPAADHLISLAQRYVHTDFGGEVTPSLGSAIHLAEKVSGVILAGPFGCGPTTISGMLVESYQQDYGVPVVVVDYNGLSDQSEKIEYFLAPIVEEFHERQGKDRIIIARG
jgi:predicted nucleotide-binding protein (sugar kinase/HSP70/actin superfamily)